MAITQVEIVGIREAHNTIGDVTYNSTNYSVLVFFDNQPPQLLEGDSSLVTKYAPYIKPRNDADTLKELLISLETNLKNMVQEEVMRIFAAVRPLPAIEGLQENKAIQVLRDAGYEVELTNHYPEGTPQGIIYKVSRKEGAYMTAELDVRHKLPNVIGLSKEEALGILFEKGFIAEVVETPSNDVPGGHVCACQRESDTSLKVKVEISLSIPDVTGMTLEEATKALEEAGAQVSVSHATSNEVAVNHVISWSNGIPPIVDVVISTGKNIYESEQLSIRTGHIDDCRGSNFWGTATIDRIQSTISIALHYKLDMEHKHEWVESGNATMDNKQNVRLSFSRVPKFESGQTQEMMLEVYSYSIDSKSELPQEVKINLTSQYGTLRKTKVDIPLTIGFDWK